MGSDDISLQRGDVTIDVAALAPGIVRILAGAGGAPEAASWAVLPEHWDARAPVVVAGRGFDTGALSVAVDAADGTVSVATKDGTTIWAASPHVAARGFHLASPIAPEERFFGLGDKPGPLEKRGRVYVQWNTDSYGYGAATDPLYKTVPFLLSVRPGGAAYGLFLDTTYRSAIDVGASDPDILAMSAEGPCRLYVIAGPTAKEVLERFTWLVGRTQLPPIWALGYGQSRYSYESADAARAVVARHRGDAIPLDALWLDIGFQDRNRPFTADPEHYSDLGALVADLREDGVHTVVITDAHIPVSPDENYAPYAQGIAGDHFVHNPDGTPYVGEVWPGDSHFPDFTVARTRDWWGTLFAHFHDELGIAGFWNDMNEPAVFKTPTLTMPLDVVHRIDEPGFATRETDHREIHNVWGMQNARATHDGLLALAPDRRPFVLTRASYAGGHRHAATWTGDNTSTEEHLRLATPQLLSLGLSGFALAGCDIGGFRRNPSPELLTRWIATGAFQPLFRNHTDFGSLAQEAWVHGPEHEARRCEAIRARYALLPYLYTALEETTRTGVPMMRPLFLEFPDEERFLVEDACFMAGPSLLVAPPPDSSIGPHPFKLPEGEIWYDHWTGARIDEPESERALPTGRLAVFVRGGSIVPRVEPASHTGLLFAGPLTLHIYPDADGRAVDDLYADDGKSLAHTRGKFFRQRHRFENGALVADAPDGTLPCPWPAIRHVVHG